MSLTAIRTGPLKIKVEFVEDIPCDDPEKMLIGQLDMAEARILVADQNPAMARVTLLHEIIHMIVNKAGMYEAVNEAMIDMLAFGMYDVITQNPDLVEYLLKDV